MQSAIVTKSTMTILTSKMLNTILRMQKFLRCLLRMQGKFHKNSKSTYIVLILINFAWKACFVISCLSASKFVKHRTIFIFSVKTIENETSESQETRYSVSKTVSETSSFQHKAGASITVGTTIGTGVPIVAMGEISVDITASITTTLQVGDPSIQRVTLK